LVVFFGFCDSAQNPEIFNLAKARKNIEEIAAWMIDVALKPIEIRVRLWKHSAFSVEFDTLSFCAERSAVAEST
jgi:hypothetical protein